MALALLVPAAAATGPAPGSVGGALPLPEAGADPQAAVDRVMKPGDGPPQIPPGESPPANGAEPGFAQGVRGALQDALVVAGLATAAAAGVGLLGFALVTRYISPKEALKNPQRAMLYGFVRGNPGVHLKRLSEEFHMKTSSILWHVRKLESAELLRSERANGFRVFYPTAGGVEVRNISRGVTALQNPNASALFAALRPGAAQTSTQLAGALHMHSGTARWHLKKLKEFSLVEEVPGPEGARYLATPLGEKAFTSMSSVAPSRAAANAPRHGVIA
jgi:predicted transcriptional regulator